MNGGRETCPLIFRRDNMKPQRLKACIKTEGLDEMKELIHKAGEKMDELSKILDAINNTEIKITAKFPAKREG